MEKLPHQEYRDELADKLREIRNSDPENPEVAKAKAQGYLAAKKETNEYQESKAGNNFERDKLSFEWGPDLGVMKIGDAEREIKKLNQNLEGEKQWRLPTKEEWIEVLKPLIETYNKGATNEELKIVIDKIKQENNLLNSNSYWTSEYDKAISLSTDWSEFDFSNIYRGGMRYNSACVRCVR